MTKRMDISIKPVVLVCVTMLAVVTEVSNFKLQILHTNDMHSRFGQTNKLSGVCTEQDKKENKCYGGFARVSEAVRLAKANNRMQKIDSLFLIAGDIYQGTILYTINKWGIVAKMTNMLEPDAMSLGNHEFDDGVDGLVPFINNVSFPVLACNLDLSKEPELAKTHLSNSTIIAGTDGIKMAIIGYVTPETKTISEAGEVEFLDEVQSINEEIERLKRDHTDLEIFIALGHSGFEMDKKIAAEVPDIDAVIGGHTNTFLYSGDQPDDEVPEGLYPTIIIQSSGRKVPVVQAYAYTKYLGQLSLEFNKAGEVVSWEGNPLLLDNKISQDPFVLQELSGWEKNISVFASRQVGSTKVLLNGDTSVCRLKECNLGNLLTDSFVDYMTKLHRLKHGKGWTTTPIAVQHSGGIRSSIDVLSRNGNVTMGDIMSVLPFINNMVEMRLTGSDLLEMLEWSVHDYDRTSKHGRFLQYSGLKVVYNIKKPNGKRVVSALARCGECRLPTYSPIRPNEIYKIILPHFIAVGGDDYKVLKRNYNKKLEMDTTDVDMIRDYFNMRSPVYTGIEGRIQFEDKPDRSTAPMTAPSVLLFILVLVNVISVT